MEIELLSSSLTRPAQPKAEEAVAVLKFPSGNGNVLHLLNESLKEDSQEKLTHLTSQTFKNTISINKNDDIKTSKNSNAEGSDTNGSERDIFRMLQDSASFYAQSAAAVSTSVAYTANATYAPSMTQNKVNRQVKNSLPAQINAKEISHIKCKVDPSLRDIPVTEAAPVVGETLTKTPPMAGIVATSSTFNAVTSTPVIATSLSSSAPNVILPSSSKTNKSSSTKTTGAVPKKNKSRVNNKEISVKSKNGVVEVKSSGNSIRINYRIPPDVLDDLASRFIINIPDNERNNLIRTCFQIELAHWFYLDFFCENVDQTKNLQPCGIKQFALQIFQHIPFLQTHLPSIETILLDWKNYKLSVPTYGGILLSEDLNYCLLVQSYFAKSSWSFPKGKINENEEPSHCAAREVFEETGFNISNLIVEDEYIEGIVNYQFTRLYIVRDVSMGTVFTPQTRNEIKCCDWFPIDSLPNNKHDAISKARLGLNANSFFMIIPFVNRLKKWIQDKTAGVESRRKNSGGSINNQNKTCNKSNKNNGQQKSSKTQKSSSDKLRGSAENIYETDNIFIEAAFYTNSSAATTATNTAGINNDGSNNKHNNKNNNNNSCRKNKQYNTNYNNNNIHMKNALHNNNFNNGNSVSNNETTDTKNNCNFGAAKSITPSSSNQSKRHRHKSMGDLDGMKLYNQNNNYNNNNKTSNYKINNNNYNNNSFKNGNYNQTAIVAISNEEELSIADGNPGKVTLASSLPTSSQLSHESSTFFSDNIKFGTNKVKFVAGGSNGKTNQQHQDHSDNRTVGSGVVNSSITITETETSPTNRRQLFHSQSYTLTLDQRENEDQFSDMYDINGKQQNGPKVQVTQNQFQIENQSERVRAKSQSDKLYTSKQVNNGNGTKNINSTGKKNPYYSNSINKRNYNSNNQENVSVNIVNERIDAIPSPNIYKILARSFSTIAVSNQKDVQKINSFKSIFNDTTNTNSHPRPSSVCSNFPVDEIESLCQETPRPNSTSLSNMKQQGILKHVKSHESPTEKDTFQYLEKNSLALHDMPHLQSDDKLANEKLILDKDNQTINKNVQEETTVQEIQSFVEQFPISSQVRAESVPDITSWTNFSFSKNLISNVFC